MEMDYYSIPHAANDRRCSLTPAEILAVCHRAFGRAAVVESAHELPGGEYNTTYRLRLKGSDPVILRAAPPPGKRLFWHEENLMHREHSIQPYFAPIAPLLPKTLMIDFTHQLIDRDYLFQTAMPGTLWKDDAETLSPSQDESLWRQFARIARTIHGVHGQQFGYPPPGRQFPTWSLTVLDYLAHDVDDVAQSGGDPTIIDTIFQMAQDNTALFDEITQSSLSHGDLWPFNMLIEHDEEQARIVAVLDADRAWWCDPLAEWTNHLFRLKTSPRMLACHAIYWDEYGPQEQGRAEWLRDLFYDAMHMGAILAEAQRYNRTNQAIKSQDRLREIAATLQSEIAG